MTYLTDPELDQLALRALDGDSAAMEEMLADLAPIIAGMARKQSHYDDTSVIERADLEQVAKLAIFEVLPKWDQGKEVKHYLLATCKAKMTRQRQESYLPVSGSRSIRTAQNVAWKLEQQLGRAPTLDEMYQGVKDSGKRVSMTRSNIKAALEAAQPPRHLDFSPDAMQDEDELDQAMQVVDSYDFEAEDESDGISDDRLLHVLSGALPAQRRMLKTAMACDYHWPTVAEELGYTNHQMAHDAFKGMALAVARMAEEELPAWKHRVDLQALYDRVRQDPTLLDLLPAQGRIYFEESMNDVPLFEIARKLEVARSTIANALSAARRSIEAHKSWTKDGHTVCKVCLKEKPTKTNFYTGHKVCKQCVSEKGKARYRAKVGHDDIRVYNTPRGRS